MVSWVRPLLKHKVRHENNVWVRNNVIPLGRMVASSDAYRSRWRVASIPETGTSQYVLIIGCPGAGKTTTEKLMICCDTEWYGRPTIMFDPMSAEHHMNKYAAKRPSNLNIPGLEPFGIPALKVMTPFFARHDAWPGSDLYGFRATDFNVQDWESLGIGSGAAVALEEAVRKNRGVGRSADALYDYFRRAPRSYLQAQKADEGGDEFYIHHSSHGSLMSHLRRMSNDNFLVGEDYWLNPRSIGALLKESPLCFGFEDESRYGRAYFSVIMWHLFLARRAGEVGAPAVYVDEADMMAPAFDRTGSFGSTGYIVKAIRKWRKYGFKVVLATQRLSSLHEDAAQMWKYMLVVGRLSAKDLNVLKQMLPEEIVEAVRGLRYEPEGGYREMLLVRPDRSFDVFVPSNCPCETFRERKRDVFRGVLG
jgi:hypothetical protein